MIVSINSTKMTRGMSGSQVGISVGPQRSLANGVAAYSRRQLLANAAISDLRGVRSQRQRSRHVISRHGRVVPNWSSACWTAIARDGPER